MVFSLILLSFPFPFSWPGQVTTCDDDDDDDVVGKRGGSVSRAEQEEIDKP
jgi:hypothetical protein